MPQHDLVLGFDVGTTNLKCLALDDTGTIVAQASEPTPQSHPRPDWTDFEPEPIWEAVCRAIRALTSQIENPSAIRGIAVSSLAPYAGPAPANPDFVQGALNVNVVLRWEYRLGSLLYVVYSRAQIPNRPPRSRRWACSGLF